MQEEPIKEYIAYIDKILNRLYEEHVDQFTYMVETPYSYHYWCEQHQPIPYKQREEMIECLIEMERLK